MVSSINSNAAAYAAQANIAKASNSAASSVSRLSSGNRIVKSSDDVAALSVGTSIKTGITTLRQALSNATQGSSLLQVADGALSQISDILQRQKSIATQANSGTLSDTERGYLNQEFQSLSAQIDQIAGSTQFSSVNLLDGSLGGSKAVTTNVSDGTSTSGTTTGILTLSTAAPANGDKITIAGVEIAFTTSAAGSADAAGKVVISAHGTAATAMDETLDNLVSFLNSSTDARLANYYFSSDADQLFASWGGGALQTGGVVIDAAQVSVATAANITIDTAANRTIAVTNPTDGLGVDRTRALGTVSGTLLSPTGTATANVGSAIMTDDIEDNAAFVGKIGEGDIGFIQGAYTTTDTIAFSLKVGNITYSTVATDVSNATATALTFIGRDEYGNTKGGQFVLNLKGAAVTASSITGQGDADPIVSQLNEALAGITFVQNRDVTSFQEGEMVSVNGVQVANLDGFSANFRSGDFSAVNVESISVTAPTSGSTDAYFEVMIDGEKYVSSSGIGNQIGLNKVIALQNTSDPTKVLTLMTGAGAIAASATTSLDLSNQEKADAFAAALGRAFGLDEGGAKLNFQIGSTSEDVIGVQIGSVASSKLFAGETLDVTTLAGAQAASDVLDSAIQMVSEIRANVGALQSRLNFTSANLQSSIENQDAARGVLLDTDVAAESTAYSTAQVQLQAGIAVLAQANQLPQNLLKLIQ